MKKILFVCTGNTCRSPMAEAIFNAKTGETFEAKSAGIFAAQGSSASPQAIQVLKEKDIDFSHSSRILDRDLLEWADVILTMTSGHKQVIKQQYPNVAEKVHVLQQFVDIDSDLVDISDPYGGSVSIYRQTSGEIESAINKLIVQLTKS
ncbi:low molecular weight protein arginine phosphatase [Bacillus solimangrovi]|uniref:Phosphotyrosine protein phosphatase I domain-containing protein n=1 Tax=Bacillus solimangrovi TaxID=1305675 RepID=A0A1E5LGV3_9BACI|nr:low molecular weight protein arginine phosphatase [Bacillus solimangrovi]OEH93303.1 hypothetical protein BFG57_12310 [Bacillus solimangrovi]